MTRPIFSMLMLGMLTACSTAVPTSTEVEKKVAETTTAAKDTMTTAKSHMVAAEKKVMPKTMPKATTPMKKPQSGYAQRLKEFQAKNPEQEAKAAIRAGKPYLMATASRGGTLAPGISPTKVAQVAVNCPTRLIHGMGDAIRNKDHLAFQRFVFTYALRFNQTMINHCKPG